MSASSASFGHTTVSLDSGRFTQTPLIIITQASLPGGAGSIIPKYTGASNTSFELYWYTGDGSATSFTSATFSWVAIQMTSAAGAG